MGILRKKTNDPINERLKQLNAEIASLDAQIRELKEKATKPATQPEPGSHDAGVFQKQYDSIPFVDNKKKIIAREEPQTTPDHYNEFGVKKFDLLARLNQLSTNQQSKTCDEKKILAQRLIASNLDGMPILRRERRIRRNRLILYSCIIAIFLYMLLALILK